jgi:hypothetical protein
MCCRACSGRVDNITVRPPGRYLASRHGRKAADDARTTDSEPTETIAAKQALTCQRADTVWIDIRTGPSGNTG